MSLYEERNEQNKPAWRTHFERERVDLSASVEAALMDNGELAEPWLDDFDEFGGSQSSETDGTTLVPPRLSLQSRPIPAVLPGQIAPTSTNTQQINTSQSVEEEQHSVPASQQPGMLTRLARRFTSSFASIKPETLQPQMPSTLPESSYTSSARAYSQMPYPESGEYSHLPLVRVIDTASSAGPIIEAGPTEPQKRHSLRRNGKVRLQTTEMAAISKTLPPPKVGEQETGEALIADVREALDRQQISSNVSEQRMEPNDIYAGTLSSAARVPLSGSGVFESERGDVMVPNVHITSASIVLVTLTTNPGPIVVQYISLHPHVGFTIHLTAPVSTRTTFNYVIMLGEIF